MLKIARHSNSLVKLKKQISKYKEQILSKEKQLLFIINELRITYNAHIPPIELLKKIEESIDDYFTLPMPEKYLAFKEIMILLQNQEYTLEFLELYNIILKYMMNSSKQEIDEYLKSLPDVAVLEKCKLLSEKIAVIKEYERV